MNIKLKAGLYTAGIVSAIIAGITLALISPEAFAMVVMLIIVCGLIHVVYTNVLHDLRRQERIAEQRSEEQRSVDPK